MVGSPAAALTIHYHWSPSIKAVPLLLALTPGQKETVAITSTYTKSPAGISCAVEGRLIIWSNSTQEVVIPMVKINVTEASGSASKQTNNLLSTWSMAAAKDLLAFRPRPSALSNRACSNSRFKVQEVECGEANEDGDLGHLQMLPHVIPGRQTAGDAAAGSSTSAGLTCLFKVPLPVDASGTACSTNSVSLSAEALVDVFGWGRTTISTVLK